MRNHEPAAQKKPLNRVVAQDNNEIVFDQVSIKVFRHR